MEQCSRMDCKKTILKVPSRFTNLIFVCENGHWWIGTNVKATIKADHFFSSSFQNNNKKMSIDLLPWMNVLWCDSEGDGFTCIRYSCVAMLGISEWSIAKFTLSVLVSDRANQSAAHTPSPPPFFLSLTTGECQNPVNRAKSVFPSFPFFLQFL